MKPVAVLGALIFASFGVAASAETLVVRSTGPSARSYPPGTAIADNARIVLQANDQVVVLDGRGTRTLKGPGTYSPVAAAAATESRSTLASLLTQRSDRRARIGAVRSMSAQPARSPNIWFVDIDRSTTVCVADPSALTMWRAGMPKPANVTVRGTGGDSAKLDWAKDQPTTPWPASMPVTSGAQYSISWDGGAQSTNVRFVVLGSQIKGLEDLASVLIKNGCNEQLDVLIETVAIPDPTSAAGG